MLIAGESAHWYRLSVGRHFCQRIGRLVETAWNVVELKAVELILQLAEFLAICFHLGIVAAQFLHDLADDQLGVASDVEASDAQLDGDA